MSIVRADMRVLFSASDADWRDYRDLLPAALLSVGVDAEVTRDPSAPETIGCIVYAPGGLEDFSPFVNCRLVQSLWAGVERIVGNATLTQPLARMVDPGLVEGMVEWVTGHALRLHLGMDRHLAGQDGVWRGGTVAPLARERTVGVLGLGELGAAVAAALAGLNFPVLGWSRRQKTLPGIRCLAGEEGLHEVLAASRILVTLLPSTPETLNLLDARRLALLPDGAMIVNPGRGTLIDDQALLAALDAGRIAQATLDVFRVEPLPPDHPFWSHPRVTVTPHVAAATRPVTACTVVAENVRRAAAGEPLLHLVDRTAGY